MSSPNENSRQMQAWLKEANAAHFAPNEDFGSFGGDSDDTGQENSSNGSISAAAGDGSLD